MNNNLLFYRKYYETDSLYDLKDINDTIFKSKIEPIEKIKESNSDFKLFTTYPGLLIGSGYGHDYKNPDNDDLTDEAFKIGFYFDFTTGMPVIPGSSVKGVLRSCFPQRSVLKTAQITEEGYRQPRRAFIESLINKELNISCAIDVDKLEDEIFQGKRDGKAMPIYERDIFFDAVPVEVNNKQGHLFDPDSITPHEHPLKNPNPIKFLKVASNVKYRFEFKLQDSKVCSQFTKEKKLELFKKLILLIGLGAKTNVGYGQFNEEEKLLNPGRTFANIRVGDLLNARIIDLTNMKFDLGFKDMTFEPKLTGISPKGFQIDQIIKVKVESVGKATRFSLIQI